MNAFERECQELGLACAAAKLRLDEGAPEAFRKAYRSYHGPVQRQDYFVRKWLGLRLNAIKRGMLVESNVTPEFLKYISGKTCIVTHEALEFDSKGQSKLNPSIDRLANEVGYRAGNICVLSQRANRAKGDKSFEEVLQIAQEQEPHAGLMPVEWARLCSLMYGAWTKAYKHSDPYILPLAALPENGIFSSTSQVVQWMLTKLAHSATPTSRMHTYWRGITRKAGANYKLYDDMMKRLTQATSECEFLGDAWLQPGVTKAFADWYITARKTVIPAIEDTLTTFTERRNDPVAKNEWRLRTRYVS